MQVAAKVQRDFRDDGILEAPGLRLGRFVVCPQSHKAFLRHFDLHLLDFAELSVGNKLLEFAYHRVAGVVVRGAEKPFCLGDNLGDFFAFFKAGGERLFTHHGEPGA